MMKTALILCSFACISAPLRAVSAQRVTIVVDPTDALIDQPLRMAVTGLRPREPVVLRSYIRADSASVLVAVGTYVADDSGTVRLDRDASTAGSYTVIDATGLLWSGRFTPIAQLANVDLPRAAVQPPEPMMVAITAQVHDSVVARTVVTRRFEAKQVRVEEVRSGDVVGRLYLPEKPGAPVVIVLSGSEGGYESSAYEAALLAAHGFAALAQAYFRANGLRNALGECSSRAGAARHRVAARARQCRRNAHRNPRRLTRHRAGIAERELQSGRARGCSLWYFRYNWRRTHAQRRAAHGGSVDLQQPAVTGHAASSSARGTGAIQAAGSGAAAIAVRAGTERCSGGRARRHTCLTHPR